MDFSFFQKREREDFLILDIGTEAVKAFTVFGKGLCYFDDVSVWHSQHYFQDITKMAIERAIALSTKGRSFKAKEVFVQLPLNFFKARIVQKLISRNSKNKISGKEERETHKTVLRECREEAAKNSLEDTGILPQELSFIKETVLRRKIDGYEVPGLLGYSGSEILLKVFLTFIPTAELEKFQKVFSDLDIKVSGISHQAEGLISGSHAEDEVFIDIGGSLTQIIIVKNGIIEDVKEFNGGGGYISEEISEALGLRSAQARALKESYSQGTISEPIFYRLRDIINRAINGWKNKLPAISFKRVSFFGGGSILKEFESAIKDLYPNAKFVLPKDDPQYFATRLIFSSLHNGQKENF